MLTITENEPTPILKDFAVFTHYLKTHRIVLTKANEFMSGTNLFELNQQMTHPAPNTSTHTAQIYYPLFHLFYHLVLSGKLFRKVREKERMVLKPTDRLQLYEDLKPAEKYFFLLETFWTDANWGKIQGEYFGTSPFNKINNILSYLGEITPGKKIRLEGKMQDDMRVSFYDIEYFCLYFSYFGFWEVTPKKTFAKQGYPDHIFSAESITPTVFGITVAPLLKEARNIFEWNLPHRLKLGEYKPVPGSPAPGEEIYAFLAGGHKSKKPRSTIKVKKGKPGDPFFLPFVSLVPSGELQKTLPRGKSEPMDGKMPSDEVFTSPNDDTGPHVDVVRIGDLELMVGQNILYLFDYGDMWRFLVELEEIRTEGIKSGNPMIIESKGKSPKQY